MKHEARELSELRRGDPDAGRVPGLACLRVSAEVGGDRLDIANDLRRRALIEGGKAQGRLLPDMQLVDVGRMDLCLDDEAVVDGDDLHHRFAGGNHPADRVHRQLMHDTILRRQDIDALQLILCGDPLLGKFRQLVVDVTSSVSTSERRSWSS